MRVNMDSSVASDPRFKMLARKLGVDWKQAVGSCFLLWLASYDRRSERFTIIEADVAAEVDGFGLALIQVGLAHADGEDIVIHGVKARIKFLLKQAQKGRKGGVKSGVSRRKQARKQMVEPEASGSAQAYTLTPSLAQSPDHTPTQTPLPPKGDVEIVIDYLNQRTGRTGAACFRANGKTRELIEARLSEHDVRALKLVCWHKSRDWAGGDMAKHLVPKTLFRASNFAEYLPSAELELATKQGGEPKDPHKVSREDFKPAAILQRTK